MAPSLCDPLSLQAYWRGWFDCWAIQSSPFFTADSWIAGQPAVMQSYVKLTSWPEADRTDARTGPRL